MSHKQHNRRILKIETEWLIDEDPDISYLEQTGFEDRLEALKRGAFGYIGIRAKAEIQLSGNLCQTIASGGLWGIEDDSPMSYLDAVKQEELATLTSELLAMGFSKRAINKAIA